MMNETLQNDAPVNFTDFGLDDAILEAVIAQGYVCPTPIQAKAIPPILAGNDVMGAAQTGTGKTAGFMLPILHRLTKGARAQEKQVKVLVLTPTRELAAQVGANAVSYAEHLFLNIEVVFGGVNINPQKRKVSRGVDILVATPGRLLDLYQQKTITFANLEVLVLDEADCMLDMGFIKDIRKIISLLPKQRQTLMFSATFSDDIRRLAQGLVKAPIEISVTPRNSTVQAIEQSVYPVDKKRKPELLKHLITKHKWTQALVFCRTKHGADKLTRYLQKNNIRTVAIHGNKSQSARTKALAAFKQGHVAILVATDIAARGLDINQLPQVVNIDLPNVPEDYVHRIGRTGRAGAVGNSISLVCAEEFELLIPIERLIKQILPRQIIENFVPALELPESSLDRRFAFKKKKKSNKSKNFLGRKQRGYRSKPL